MAITLCLLVKDEMNTIADCLDAALPWVDEVLVMDTGSTDGTPEFLRQRYGIRALEGRLSWDRCLCKQDLRNVLFSHAQTDWLLSLDADERLSVNGAQSLRSLATMGRADGFFGLWNNHLHQAQPFPDYKLFLFRSRYRMQGLIHENVQTDLRRSGGHGVWTNELVVDHFPEATKSNAKQTLYMQRLECAIQQDPGWHRYHWFKGYMHFSQGDMPAAERHLQVSAQSQNPLFPVEKLNSLMVLASIQAAKGSATGTLHQLHLAAEHWTRHRTDFEMAINWRAEAWILESLRATERQDLAAVKPYRFAC